jgi:hypothetical protein
MKMTHSQLRTKILALSLSGVERTYYGKIGCMCGCHGRYRCPFASRAGRDDVVNQHVCDRDLSGIKAFAGACEDLNASESWMIELDGDVQYIYFEDVDENRCWAVYLNDEGKSHMAEVAFDPIALGC